MTRPYHPTSSTSSHLINVIISSPSPSTLPPSFVVQLRSFGEVTKVVILLNTYSPPVYKYQDFLPNSIGDANTDTLPEVWQWPLSCLHKFGQRKNFLCWIRKFLGTPYCNPSCPCTPCSGVESSEMVQAWRFSSMRSM